jgi:hypothetical protein
VVTLCPPSTATHFVVSKSVVWVVVALVLLGILIAMLVMQANSSSTLTQILNTLVASGAPGATGTAHAGTGL